MMTWLSQRQGRFSAVVEQQSYGFGLLILTVVLVFYPVLGFEFITLDDGVNVYSNHYLQNLTLGNFFHFWEGPHENLYIPLTYSVWTALAGLSRVSSAATANFFDPQLFHAANLIAHLSASLTVFLILTETMNGENRAVLIGALFFAVHPIQVEAVAWVTAFRDVFSVCLALLALLFYIRYLRNGGWDGGKRLGYYLGTAFFLMALLAKPGVVILPFIAAMIVFLSLRTSPRRMALELFPWLLMALPIVLITRFSQLPLPQDFVANWGERVLVAGDAVTFYFGKLILPIHLAADYGRSPKFILDHYWVWITGLLPYFVGLLLIKRLGRLGWLAAGIFVIALLPVLGLIPFDFQQVSTVTDHYVYFAMLGPALAVSLLAARYRTKTCQVGWTLLIFVLGLLSIAQLRHWQNSLEIYRNTLTVNPKSWYTNNNLGNIYMRSGDYGKAEALFRKAVELRPNFHQAYNNLGLALAAEGHQRDAFAAYKMSIKLSPGYAEPYGNLAILYQELGMRQESIDFYNKSLLLNPYQAEFQDSLGSIYLEEGRAEEAKDSFERAIEADPSYAGAYLHLARWYLSAGKIEEAKRYHNLAVSNGLVDQELAERFR